MKIKQIPHIVLVTLMTVLAILPPILLGLGVLQNSVNVPYWDDWITPAPILLKFKEHNVFSFQDFIGQANESRPLFPRFIFITLAFLTNWDLRYQMLVSLLLALLTAFNIFLLSKKTISKNIIQLLFLSFLGNLLMFSPLSRNWTWGIQTIVFIPIACITSIALIFHSRVKYERQIFFGICLATISTFSYANGLLAWIVTIPSLLFATFDRFSGHLRTKLMGLSLWIGGFLVNIGLYFYNYTKPGHHPSFLEGLKNPLQAIQFFVAFLGCPLGQRNLSRSIVVGSVLVFIFVLICCYILIWGRNKELVKRMIPWLVIACYSLSSALITALGRVGFGLEVSLSPRYINFSLFFAVALIYLTTIVLQDITTKKLETAYYNKFLVRFISSGLIVIFLSLSIKSFSFGMETMQSDKDDRIYGKTCLLLMNLYTDKNCIGQNIYSDLQFVIETAPKLSDYNFLTPKLIEDKVFALSEQKGSSATKIYGDVNQFSEDSSRQFFGDTSLSGWAILPDKRRKADAVILTYEGIEGDSQPFAIVRVNQKCSNLPQQFNQSIYQESCWQYDLSTFQIAANAKQITAWSFDTETAKTYPIKSIPLLTSPTNVTPNLTNFGTINLSSDQTVGNIDAVNNSPTTKQTLDQNTSILVSGWAILSQENRVADKVFLTIGNDNTIIAATSVNGDRPDVANAFNNPALTQSGWMTTISSSILKQEPTVLKAWAYDAKNKVIYQIPNTFELQLTQSEE